MLSNKLTFSLVFVLALALIAGPAFAQTLTLSDELNVGGSELASQDFVVFEKTGATLATNGIIDAPVGPFQVAAGAAANFPDIDQLLRFGGTIELLIAPAATSTMTYGTRSLVISEIMWGLDRTGSPAVTTDAAQWIEVYNETENALEAGTQLRLLFTANLRQPNNRLGTTVTLSSNTAGGVTVVAAGTGGAVDFTVVDSVWMTAPDGKGGRSALGPNGEAIDPLVSMYRKRSLNDDGTGYRYDPPTSHPRNDGFANGQDGGQWFPSNTAGNSRINIAGTGFIGTPGYVHLERAGRGGPDFAPAAVAAAGSGAGIIINEIRDDPSDDNVDWVELYNNSDAGSDPISINNYHLRLTSANTAGNRDRLLAVLPDYRMQPGEYLLIVNRDPEQTILAGGVNLNDETNLDVANRRDSRDTNRGAQHPYFVDTRLDLPSNGNYLLVLRSNANNATQSDNAGGNNNYHENFVDFAGTAFISFAEQDTGMYPLRGWGAPGDRTDNDLRSDGNTFSHRSRSYGREANFQDNGAGVIEYRPDSRANRLHRDDWQNGGFGYMGGVGYDRDIDRALAPGTPGYQNAIPDVTGNDRANSNAADDYMFSGVVSISEVMYDAGRAWNLVQWIELYNSSMTEAINLDGWELEIRNLEDPEEPGVVDSFVDSVVRFDPNTYILPNQTLLIVSGNGANDIPRDRVYDLHERHRRELGLDNRGSVLLSNYGFYLELRPKTRTQQDGWANADGDADKVGNIDVDGPRRTHMWPLYKRDPSGVRQSIVRTYGTDGPMGGGRQIDGTPDGDAPNTGTESTSWHQSLLEGASLTYFGHRSDVGSPGYRLGGPLPVSLSSFRPVRDDATGDVVIRWVTESELNNAGFNILRSETKNGEFTVVNLKGIIPGHGTTSEKHVYEWKDTTAKPNVVYYYQIEDVSLDGNRTTLATTHLRGNVNAAGKVTTTWGDLKTQ